MLVRNSAFWNPDHPRNKKRPMVASTSPVYWDWSRTHWIWVKTGNPCFIDMSSGWAKDLNVKSFYVHSIDLLIMPHMRSYKRKCGERKKPKSNAPRMGRREFVKSWK
jgi:capsular polysaccharide biosynthesis protein